MHATDLSARSLGRDETGGGAMQTVSDDALAIVLVPLSRPEFGEIRIDDSVFAVGRAEPPFVSYGQDILTMLSRRHARIFRENGTVYLADLGSRNGTTLNRADIGQAPHALHDGDEIGFGGVLSYRVQVAPHGGSSRADAGLVVTLTPESVGSGLETIVITRLPYLVSKAGAAFVRYQDKHGPQMSYLSRRQAHIFDKGGCPYIEDLGSTNGTFVDGLRLQEHAVPLQDGELVAFGGDHFTYRVGIANGADLEPAPAQTRTRPAGSSPAEQAPVARDKTTFVAAPTSFLEIFCADDEARSVDPTDGATLPDTSAVKEPARPAIRRPRGRVMVLLSELATLLASSEAEDGRRRWWKGALLVIALAALAAALYQWGAAERELKDAVARGEHAQAATLADRQLERRPDDVDLRALSTESALKAYVPTWLAKLQAHDFDGAHEVLAGMSALGARNPDLRPLIAELAWLGDLERLVSSRGGPDAPIRIYADEDRIEALMKRWNDSTGEHQRALARIASHVPQFSGPYGEALTHLRKLQSEATVYLNAIERLKATIAAELNRDSPESLEPVLKDVAQRYPRLGGLDNVRQDLARYLDIRKEARTPNSGRLFAAQLKARFVTPPFQQSYRALAAGGQLPPEELLRQYEAATQAWQAGRTNEALAGLQKMAVGPWAPAAARALEERRGVLARFTALQQARGTGGYAEQLLAFRESLDPEEDVHFARATDADLALQKDQAMARAQESMNRARGLWQEYRTQGAIDASQRIETSISNSFRERARLLAEADRQAQQGMQIYAELSPGGADAWAGVRDEIGTEARQQRSALLELRNVLSPQLLKAKLALLGGPTE